MKTSIFLLLMVAALSAQETLTVHMPPPNNPTIKPVGMIIASAATGVAGVALLSAGLYSQKYEKVAGANIGAGISMLSSIPLFCASTVMSVITIRKYHRWKKWEERHGMHFDMHYDAFADRYSFIFSKPIPGR